MQDIQELTILHEAVENANEAFITIDAEHRVLFFNRAAEKMFGYARQEVLGRDLCLLLAPEHRESHPLAVQQYLPAGEPPFTGREAELTGIRRSGERFPALISFSVAEIDHRTFFTALIRDMAETRGLQRQVAQAERLALLGRVVAEITHEIKNPLVMIGGWARRLHRTVREEEARRRLADILAQVERLEHLLAELRNLYVPRKQAAETIDAGELLREAFRLVKADCEERDIALELRLEGPRPLIMGDREKLLQVLLNLIKNSMEALAPAGGSLLLALATVDGYAELTVADNGPGIPAELRERVFTPFFTTKRQGTGLGLCVCKRIMDDHPGSALTLESVEGQGTAATLRFPIHRFVEE
ncbi:MAG: PAS domain S-box protein [Desulfobacteraceae bacterium]|nr:PAS domain S-box protein [Desulfobacteraceae bacterium]